MKLAVFAFTLRGCATARKAAGAISYEGDECRRFTMEKFAQPDFEAYMPPLADFMAPVFSWADAIIFVGSTGMAVRAVAPFVRDKKTDPAVICIDEGGSFVISLLSGHIGGANAMAKTIASAMGAVPVITTATDVNGRFSVDDWAARHGCCISSMALAKAVSAAILTENIPICADAALPEKLPEGLERSESGALGIHIGWSSKDIYEKTLHLVPRVLRLGIGCRRGTGAEAVEEAVERVLKENGIHREAIACAASIDLKADEAGLREFCGKWGLPISFYTPEELLTAEGEFTHSEFVRSVTGVDNVCERSAMLGAKKLVVKKSVLNGVTAAVAEEEWEIEF